MASQVGFARLGCARSRECAPGVGVAEALCDPARPPAQIEIGDGAELTADFLYDEVHPKQHAFKQAFAKPKGPGGKRGHKRLIRGPGENGDDS